VTTDNPNPWEKPEEAESQPKALPPSAEKALPSSQQTEGSQPKRFSRKSLLGLVSLGLLLAVGLYLWRGPGRETRLGQLFGGKKGQSQAEGETYYCPMHPTYKSDKPGNCPICSMKLVKLENAPSNGQGKPEGGSQPMPAMPGMKMGSDAGAQAAPETPAPNAIFVAPRRQQLIGVHSVPVALKPLTKEIRTVGKVAYDETKVTHIHTKVTGYVEQVFADYVGQVVKRGDPLFTFYSPDLVATQEEYLLALRSRKALKESSFEWVSSGSQSLVEASRQRLRLWDITDGEIERLEKEGKAKRALTIYSPVSGIVTERAAYHHGRYVSPEMDLYTLVDLSTVWVLGEVYEYELPFVKVGQTTEIEFPYASARKSLRGKINFVYPYLEPKTRTAQVRLEFLNPNFVLKPETFVNLKLKVNLGQQLVVPEDAVLNTGTGQYVFVDKGEGYFEPRLVKLGAEAGGYYAIESGLSPKERVVTAANFILDSESRLKGVFANMVAPEKKETSGAAGPGQNLKMDLLEPKVAKVGVNPIRLVVKDAAGNPVTDADVEVTLFMPQMGSMAPMTSKAKLNPLGNGQYGGNIDIPMAWSWQTTVSVRKEGKLVGSLQTTLTAR
jgi:Cu(I)/Ag(I) efflux system membrane fusion protein